MRMRYRKKIFHWNKNLLPTSACLRTWGKNPDATLNSVLRGAQCLIQELLVGELLCNCDHNVVEVNFCIMREKDK